MALASSSGAERYANLKRQEGALQRKIIEMEGEADQHKVVVKAIEGMEGSRRCFRLVGGVLVERTVAEVLPAVRENLEAIERVVADLKTRLGKASTEALKLQRELGVSGNGGATGGAGAGAASGGAAAAQGVLA